LHIFIRSKNYPAQNQKSYVPGFSPKCLVYGAETWTLNIQQTNKLLATGMNFSRRSAGKSRKENVRNGTIRAIMEVGRNSLEVIKEKRLRWFGHEKRIPGNRLTEGKRRKGRHRQRWMDGVSWSIAKHGPTEEDTRDRDLWRNLDLGEGKQM
jgi:hypothetical protein